MENRPRAVVDTNVLISAALSPTDMPRKALLRIAEEGVLLASEETFAEFASRIRRPKFDPYLDPEDREEYIAWILSRSEFVEITERIRACQDPADDKFLELAVNGGASVIISGDNDLLVLHLFRGLTILNPRDFVSTTWV